MTKQCRPRQYGALRLAAQRKERPLSAKQCRRQWHAAQSNHYGGDEEPKHRLHSRFWSSGKLRIGGGECSESGAAGVDQFAAVEGDAHAAPPFQ